jgi:hypothetical protein
MFFLSRPFHPAASLSNTMIKDIAIYLHGAGTTEEKIIRVPEEVTVREVLEAARKAGMAVDADTIILVEDAEDELAADSRLCDHGIKDKHHLHCHNCRKVEVTVTFNGQSKSRKFAPSRKVKRVLKWAVEAFELHGVDAENKELRIGGEGGTILQSQQHIGSFVHAPKCHLDLYLTAIVEVQG